MESGNTEWREIEAYKEKCEFLMSTWYSLLGYHALDEWFETNRCCIPITLAKLIDPRIIKQKTTL